MKRLVALSQVGLVPYLATAVLAVIAYLYGLDGRFIPKNGDESVYFHILRLTASSGSWLPLQSDLDHMRNTKPPMLYWQGIVSTHWGRDWNLWALRLPSVAYSFATAILVYLLGSRLSPYDERSREGVQSGVIAALIFLASFSTFRYGRPFLTNAPEVFWLFLPFFLLLYTGRAAFESHWAMPLAIGVTMGVGLLYKSFALAAPMGFGLAWWYWHDQNYRLSAFIARDSSKLIVIAALSLSIFSLWFALDPDPMSIWQEFVVGENAEKFDAEKGYLRTLLWGGSSIWSLALNYPLNTGLLALPVLGLAVISWRRRHDLSRAEQLLWLWMIALFIVFSLPSQRSGRYLLPAMPALAVLLALRWRQLSRWLFVATLLLSAAVLLFIGYLSLQLHQSLPASPYPLNHWLLLLVSVVVIGFGIASRPDSAPAALASVFLVYLCFGSAARPLDGELGQYKSDAVAATTGNDVWVPCNFRAAYEAHRFSLPGANVLGYSDADEPSVQQLSERYALFTVRVPINEPALSEPYRCDGCQLIGERLDIKSRHTPQQIDAMLAGRVFEHLFVRERLFRSSKRALVAHSSGTLSECR